MGEEERQPNVNLSCSRSGTRPQYHQGVNNKLELYPIGDGTNHSL